MLNPSSWGWLFLPFSGLAGVLCAALALAYVRRVVRGAPIDAETLRAAFVALCRGSERMRVSGRMGGLCAGMLAPAGLAFALAPSELAAARFAACCVLLVLAVIDARCGLLPDALTLPLMWAGLLLARAGVGVSLHDAILAVVAGYLLLWGVDRVFQVWRGRAGLGGGDMKLVAALGAWLGWEILPGVLLGACCAAVLFAFFGRRRHAWGTAMPFGPFLAFAGASGLVGGPVVQFLF